MTMRASKTPLSKSGRDRTKPRRRVVPLWRRRGVIGAVALAVIVAATGTGTWLWRAGLAAPWLDAARASLIEASGRAGLAVEEILVVGRSETDRVELLRAVGVERGGAILGLDPAAAKKRVEALPWVRVASVERQLPDTVLLRLVEQTPLALWQDQGRFFLIDGEGAVITDRGLGRFRDLMVVVGADAARQAPGLMAMLARQPDLAKRVKAAFRVGARRWSLRLDDGVEVHLPAENPAGAWTRLAELERTQRILDRDVTALDLRLPDRLILRRPPEAETDETPPGQET